MFTANEMNSPTPSSTSRIERSSDAAPPSAGTTINPLEDSSAGVSLLEMKKRLTPAGYAQFLRAKGDVFWWPAGKFYVVTDYNLAKDLLKDPSWSADRSAFFISRMPNLDLRLIGDFFGVISKMMVMSDNPEHAKRRAVAAQGMDEGLMSHYRPMIERTVKRLIHEATDLDGQIEFVEDIAMKLPSMVLADLFHIDEKDRPDFYRWSNNMTQFFGGASQYRNEDGVEVNTSALSIRTYFEKLVEKRKAEPHADFLTMLLQNQARFGLTDQEIISQAIMMLVAGQITTTDQFCNNMYTMLTTPGVLDQMRANPELLTPGMEELNRLDPGVSYLFRVAKAPTKLGEFNVEAGQTVFISVHAVNRDPAVFDQPDECFLARSPNAHMAYGHGAHYCLGARLARLQMNICFHQLITRFPNLRLSSRVPAVRKHHSLAFSGFERLPLETD
jgi:cytochrome P450